MQKQLIIFTDLDATLLDHYTYSFQEAQETISLIQKKNIPLILTSSKTFAEIKKIQNKLKIKHPIIFENGSAIAYPRFYFHNSEDAITLNGYDAIFLSRPIHFILELLTKIRHTENFKFKGFSEMSVEELVEKTGLSETEAELARQRMCSEPILWQDNEEKFQKFQDILKQQGLKLLKGGRFFHVIGDTDKGKAVRFCLKLYRKKWPHRQLITIGVGDSPNDLDFLAVVDFPVLVQKPDGSYTKTNFEEKIIHAPGIGPRGWNAAILKLIEQLEKTSD